MTPEIIDWLAYVVLALVMVILIVKGVGKNV
jgi:heme exporter protein D